MSKPLSEYAGLTAQEKREQINRKIASHTWIGTCEACGKESKNLQGHIMNTRGPEHEALAVKIGLRR